MTRSSSIYKKDAFILLLLCLCTNAIVSFWYEARIGHDSAAYLSYSQRMMERGYLYVEVHHFWYLGYVLFITAAKSLWNHIQMIVLLQLFFHAIGIVALYYSSIHLFRNRLTAWATALSLMLWPDIVFWNFQVMTESFCTSFTCIVILLLVLQAKRQFNPLWLLPAILILFFVRPTGIAVLIAFTLMYVSIYQKFLCQYQKLLVVAAIALLACFYVLINEMLDTFVLVENYAIGEIVYRATSLPENYPGKDMILLTPPHDLIIPDTGLKPIPRVMLFILHNPLYFIKLSGMKLFYFLTHTKPYYSWIHNLLLLVILLPMYVSIINTIIRGRLSYQLCIFLTTFFALHCLIVMFTTEDWDGRFLMPLLPFVFLFGGHGCIVRLQSFYSRYLEGRLIKKLKGIIS